MKQALDGWAPPTSLKAGLAETIAVVPGQQGPGGRHMVNRRHWYRRQHAAGHREITATSGRPGPWTGRLGVDPGGRAASRRSPHVAAARPRETGGQAGPVHQPVLLARSRVDGPAPDRPGRVAGRPGVRVPRALPRRAATSPASPAACVRDPRGRAHPPRARDRRWAAAARWAG